MSSQPKHDRIRRDQLLGRLACLAGLVVGACLIFAGPNRSSEQPLATASVESTQQLVSLSSEKPKPTENRSVGTRPIESIRVGDRVLARNPEVSDAERAEWEEPDWNEWLHLSLQMPLPSDDQDAEPKILNIEILRPESWFWEQVSFAVEEAASGKEAVSPEPEDSAEEFEPPLVPLSPLRGIYRELAITSALLDAEEIDVVGMTVEMDLPEMGAFGTAVVTSLETCPPIREGKGQPVTATFSHPPSTQVLDVYFQGEADSIGVTDNHLFWSVDREQFIPIGQMEIGEQVQTYFGETNRIAAQLPRPGPQVVYNLEVYGEHVYFVGEQGLLAHNTYPLTPRNRGWSRALRSRFNQELKDSGVASSLARRRILNNIRDNFVEYDNVRIGITSRERSFWRRWDGINADEIGRYGTKGPRSENFTRNSLAVRQDWNALTNQSRLRVRKGSLLIEGTTAPKIDVNGTKLSGGGHQLFVPNLTDLIR